MLQRHTISHLKAMIVDKEIPGGQGRGSIMGLPRPLLLKRSIYHWMDTVKHSLQILKHRKTKSLFFKAKILQNKRNFGWHIQFLHAIRPHKLPVQNCFETLE